MLRRIASNPSLRRSVGAGSLRPQTYNVCAATVHVPPPVPCLPSRPLVSAVLFSRDSYEDKRVQELKSELKQRGLTTSGKRTDLIQRLVDSDSNNAKVFPAPVGESSEVRRGNAGDHVSAKVSGRRSKSTSAKARAKSTAGTSAAATSGASIKPPPSDGHVGTPEGASIPHPPNMEPGQVSTMTGDVEQISAMEALPNAPGVPPEKQAQTPIVFDVKIPYEKPELERGPNVPLMTAYFHPEEKTFSGYSSTDGPVAHVPKVRTVSGEDTYHGGGVSHHHPMFEDNHIIGGPLEEQVQASNGAGEDYTLRSAFQSVVSSMQKDLGLSNSTKEGTEAASTQAAETAGRAVETTKSVLREARNQLGSALRGSSGSNGKSYSTSSVAYSSSGHERPLHEEERRGLYVLGGIVAGGFLLGSFGNQSKRRQEKVKQEIASHSHKTWQHGTADLVPDVELAGLVARAETALRQ